MENMEIKNYLIIQLTYLRFNKKTSYISRYILPPRCTFNPLLSQNLSPIRYIFLCYEKFPFFPVISLEGYAEFFPFRSRNIFRKDY